MEGTHFLVNELPDSLQMFNFEFLGNLAEDVYILCPKHICNVVTDLDRIVDELYHVNPCQYTD